MRSNGGATLYTKVWKKGGGPNPAFLLLIHENPASRTSVNDIPNIVFFPNPASVPKFWRIALPQRQSNPVSRQYFPNAALCFGQIRFFLIFAPSPQSERLEPRLADVNITFAEFGIFFKNSWFHWCEVFTDLQLIFTDLALIFWAFTFSYSIKLLMQFKLLRKPTSDFSWLLTPLGVDIKID